MGRVVSERWWRVGWGLMAGALLAGCGQFGLPTGRDAGDLHIGEPALLDMDPKLGYVGEVDLEIVVVGIDTYFDDTTTVRFPQLPGLVVSDLELLDAEHLLFTVDIPEDTSTITSVLRVHDDRDGDLTLEPGFTVMP